jgi:uncharacterized membrane protein
MLGNLSITVGSPWWLLILPLVLPPLVVVSTRSLAGLGLVRRVLAIALRSAVVTLIVLALAEVQTVRKSDRLTTMFLIDASQSVPQESQGPALSYVSEASRKRRKDDMAGLIVFGREPRVEVPPAPTELNLLGIESTIDAEYTDMAAAIKLALATFPEDTARRIVILSDGNENRGNALEQALAAKALGVPIDVLPIEYHYDREVLVEKVSIPPDVKKGETVNINVVIRASEPTSGTLQIFQKADNYRAPAPGNEKPVPVELQRGINVFNLKQRITEPNFYTFTAEFVADRSSGDRRTINNVAEGFTHARGTAQVLLIEGTPGEHVELVRALRENKLEVTTLAAPARIDGSGAVGGDPLPIDLAQLQPYDTVILGNVPKEAFTETQHQLLESNTHDMGAGLIMLGGRDSFGAGGWMNTPVEKALPVDMQIKALKVQGLGAMVMIMHASEIAEGNYWQKVVAKAALNALSSYDYAGMIHWEGQEAWLFTLQPIGERRSVMLRAIDRMTPGDMPDFDPSLQMAMNGLMAVRDAMTRHIVIISDGDPTPPSSGVISQLAAKGITVTTVLTAAHGNDPGAMSVMRNLATKTKGRFYNVTNPKALPRIYQKEARTISRPLIFEQETPWAPRINYLSEPVTGLPPNVPPISGLVLTSVKENELVETPLTSPLPAGQVNPLLAHWSYGLGRAVAFTSDAGRRWAKQWPDWQSYSAFWSQVVRWSLRPADRGNLALSIRRDEGRIKIVVDALDKENQFLNFLTIQGNVVSPDLRRSSIELVQTAPGRYEATIEDAEASGNYFVNLGYRGPEGVQGMISSGVSVPYSDEYRELRSNPAALETVATLTGGQVSTWRTRPDGRPDLARTLNEVDHFRRDANLTVPRAYRRLWPNLLWAACLLFLSDIAVRRIAPDFARMRRVAVDQWKKLRGHDVAPPVEYMEKLKSRKAEVGEQLDRSRAAARFEPLPGTPTAPVDETLLTGGAEAPRESPKPKPATPGLAPEAKKEEPESYTSRLMRAKQKVWEDREKNK